jgi:transposase InsO family protein
MAAIDWCTREIDAWHLETSCRAKEAVRLIERAASERAITPAMLTLATDNGSAFIARGPQPFLRAELPGSRCSCRRGLRQRPQSCGRAAALLDRKQHGADLVVDQRHLAGVAGA